MRDRLAVSVSARSRSGVVPGRLAVSVPGQSRSDVVRRRLNSQRAGAKLVRLDEAIFGLALVDIHAGTSCGSAILLLRERQRDLLRRRVQRQQHGKKRWHGQSKKSVRSIHHKQPEVNRRGPALLL